MLGATYSPHCARIHPAHLVRGLARVNERLGVSIFEDTAVTRILAGDRERSPRVITSTAEVRARYVLRATEGFTSQLPGHRRRFAPLYSLMIASAPQSRSFWDLSLIHILGAMRPATSLIGVRSGSELSRRRTVS